MYLAEPIPQSRTLPIVTTVAIHVLFVAGLALSVGVVKIAPDDRIKVIDIPPQTVQRDEASKPFEKVPPTARRNQDAVFNVPMPVFTIGDNEKKPGEGAITPSDDNPRPIAHTFTQVRLLASAEPSYPNISILRREEGVVLVRATITPYGTIGELAIERSSGFSRLDAAALEAVKLWRFSPAQRDAQAIPGVVVVPVRFELQGR